MVPQQCPYDATPVEVESSSGGSFVVTCPSCGAAWEWHNAWLRRLQAPDRAAVLRARDATVEAEPTA